jgi:hypothetical protein
MVTMGIFPIKKKIPMAELGIESGTSWSVVRNSDHEAGLHYEMVNREVRSRLNSNKLYCRNSC